MIPKLPSATVAIMYRFQERIYNFGAGPAMLPNEVMEIAAAEFLNYKGSGMSLMEVSHREPLFEDVLQEAESLLRKLLNIGEGYSVAFFSGGATLHFSALPLNLLKEGESFDVAHTGIWTKKAWEEGLKFNGVNVIYDATPNNFTETPVLTEADLSGKGKYLHITSNNTIYGSQYPKLPKIQSIPLVADMTSELLSRKIEVADFGVIFAGAQKNIGPSGLSVLIIRNDLIGISGRKIPVLLDYSVMIKNKSLYNTPATYSIYIAKLVFEWLDKLGGVSKMEAVNEEKAKLLYDFVDSSSLYVCPVQKKSRSKMNVVFLLKDKKLETKFLDEAEKNGLHGLGGHRLVGGFRASIYNSMPLSGVQKLVSFMKEFESKA
ncbi:3-phosphoserine/phosphohydroxythreonine transaminase [Leptospira gomenensis]|uniref:Phosphoserine aminotransferase n=1 Tax=Leptospira gomenensis TaxID=2484974 RepID=A0A5F1YD55_9LEPT|nr:3-phosphoserine/phosphohydroxythreonine transaminase [Leptospira gomenensis]TGK35995.1 3-phosphoserine/phosphohydroxythreonine transaminase [Leptospira gomenensis]TGK39974.1 3-phosphoserine/phosphohydroxythreonine transaminase [Leptospira gomenensis]TGK51423.1 3-phosphoserine/phosphohydroxythreonine transaminase [Leptospira gomenensis]TGK64902.1 3-phosphoserine/phosphohydroxythreonine transaminase [Leptospira gomenensis]